MSSAIITLGSPIFQAFYPGTALPLVGGKLFTLTPGGDLSSFIASYSTVLDAQNQTNAHTNPIILDASGSAPVVLTGPTKLVLQDPTGFQEWSFDNYNLAGANIYDTSGNPLLLFSSVNGAVNSFTIGNAVTGSSPTLSVTGGDTNIGANISVKGTANISLNTGIAGTTVMQGNSTTAGTAVVTGSFTTNTSVVTPVVSFTGAAGVIQYLGVTSMQVLSSASAVNFTTVTSTITGTGPIIAAAGADSNIVLNINGKGTSGINIQGRTSGVTASAGYIGELKTSNILAASAIAFANGVAGNVTSISLTAGNWIIYGNISATGAGGVTLSRLSTWTATTSATLPDASLYAQLHFGDTFTNIGAQGIVAPSQVVAVSGTTTLYLSVLVASTGTVNICGNLIAMRV